MAFRYFYIDSRYPDASADELNRFLASARVVKVKQKFVSEGDPHWSVCVEYVPGDVVDKSPCERRDGKRILKSQRATYCEILRFDTQEIRKTQGEHIPSTPVWWAEKRSQHGNKRAVCLSVIEFRPRPCWRALQGTSDQLARNQGRIFAAFLARQKDDRLPGRNPAHKLKSQRATCWKILRFDAQKIRKTQGEHIPPAPVLWAEKRSRHGKKRAACLSASEFCPRPCWRASQGTSDQLAHNQGRFFAAFLARQKDGRPPGRDPAHKLKSQRAACWKILRFDAQEILRTQGEHIPSTPVLWAEKRSQHGKKRAACLSGSEFRPRPCWRASQGTSDQLAHKQGRFFPAFLARQKDGRPPGRDPAPKQIRKPMRNVTHDVSKTAAASRCQSRAAAP